MSIANAGEAYEAAEEAAGERVARHWPEGHGLRGWITTVDHKRIGRRYMVTARCAFSG
ncbi:hypothetical protein ACQP1V_29020 [Microtetraspora malaysiensis]|uniref:hypothetical protein n=1 Tax=Microtetraspora malaysiensis TaxID=161358 RepID=UPI003D90F61F